MIALKDATSKPSTAIIAGAPTAPLPKAYESAKTALAECTRIDECREWANKAQALASNLATTS